MGCGSSAPSNVVEAEGVTANGKSIPEARPPPTGASDDDIPTEIIPDNPPVPVKPPLAFEISLESDTEGNDDNTQGLVKKHPPRPPKRLQRLNTLEITPPTLEELQEKLESAEKRRQTILQNRIASANKVTRQLTKMQDDIKDENYEVDDILQSPKKDLTEMKNMINAEEHGVIA